MYNTRKQDSDKRATVGIIAGAVLVMAFFFTLAAVAVSQPANAGRCHYEHMYTANGQQSLNQRFVCDAK